MRDPMQGPAAVVLDTGDDDWALFVTNVKFDPSDGSNWKFLEKVETMAWNGVLDTLVTQYGVDTILFEKAERLQFFRAHGTLGAYSDLYRPVSDAANAEL